MTKEQLAAENERLGKEAAALRGLLTVIADGTPPMYAVPGNHRDGWLQAGSNRIHAVAGAAAEAMKYAGTDGFTGSLHAMAGYLRHEFARPLGYEPETDEPERVVFTDEDEDEVRVYVSPCTDEGDHEPCDGITALCDCPCHVFAASVTVEAGQ